MGNNDHGSYVPQKSFCTVTAEIWGTDDDIANIPLEHEGTSHSASCSLSGVNSSIS